MKHLTVRLQDLVHAALSEELKEWQKLRGPRFSLNNLCEEKLSTPFPPTQWISPTTGTISSPSNYVYTVTYNPPVLPFEPQKREKKNARKGK
jgi:hypothetical protein